MRGLPRTTLLAALLLPSTALAGDAVVPPLVAKGVDPLVNLNLTSLISSEADFLGEWDTVNQLEEAPKALNSACLGNTACLGGIARAASADAVIAGSVVPGGGSYEFTLVYFDASRSRIVRTKTFTLPDSPAEIADGMGPNVRELVTGDKPADPADATLAGFEDVDLFEDDYGEDAGNSRRISTAGSGARELSDGPEEEARKAAEEEARRKAEAEARRRAEEESRRRAEEEARRKAEEEARRQAEDEARRKREEEQAAAAAAAAAARFQEDDEDDFENFSLSSSTSVVDSDRGADSRERDLGDDPLADMDDDPPRRSSTSSRSSYDDLDDEPASSRRSSSSSSSSSSSRYDDLDDSKAVTREKEPRERSSRDKSEPEDRSLMVAARVGYAPYQGLNFISYGGEITYKVAGGLAVGGGIEAWAVQRDVPVAFLEVGEPTKQWNTIIPISVGAHYHLGSGVVQPYLGADAMFVPGLVRDQGGVAAGGRARAGANFVVADAFAINLNAGVGFLGAGNFEQVATDMKNGGLSPQLSAGTVLRF